MNPKVLLAVLFAIAAPLQSASTQPAPASSLRNKERSRYVGFFNERDLAWRPFEVEGVPPGVQIKLLSRDAKSGAASLLARFPTGWRNAAAGYHASDMEMFVLEGAVKIGDRRFSDRCFTYVPAGVLYGPMAVEKETTALWFFDGDASFTASARSKPNFSELDRHRTVIATTDASLWTSRGTRWTSAGSARAETIIEIPPAAGCSGVTIHYWA